MIRNGSFASESVSEGHPDKLADRISDAVLDEFLREDPDARVAAYAIGVAEPVSFGVDTGGTGDQPDEDIAAALLAEFDLRPAAIIERLELKTPIYYPTAAYGHFGREEFAWEKVGG